MVVGVFGVDVVLRVKETGSAEIVVAAVSSSDSRVRVEKYLGRTIGDVLRNLNCKGYRLTFVTDKFFVCTKLPRCKYRKCRGSRKQHVTLFMPELRA